MKELKKIVNWLSPAKKNDETKKFCEKYDIRVPSVSEMPTTRRKSFDRLFKRNKKKP